MPFNIISRPHEVNWLHCQDTYLAVTMLVLYSCVCALSNTCDQSNYDYLLYTDPDLVGLFSILGGKGIAVLKERF